jgi:hypothetical protein
LAYVLVVAALSYFLQQQFAEIRELVLGLVSWESAWEPVLEPVWELVWVGALELEWVLPLVEVVAQLASAAAALVSMERSWPKS